MNHDTPSHTSGPATTALDPDPVWNQQGITLVELLVVLVVIGIGALVVLDNMNSMYRKYELESSVRSLGAFFDAMPNHAKEQNRAAFLDWEPGNSIATIYILDSTGNPVDLANYPIPDYLVVTPAGDLTYRCDMLGRAYLGNNANMLSATQEFRITHRDMLSGRVEPTITYTLSLSPLWHMTTTKTLGS
jgi:prepilin-type N-terminal cleavage/methylation domain-containing protein